MKDDFGLERAYLVKARAIACIAVHSGKEDEELEALLDDLERPERPVTKGEHVPRVTEVQDSPVDSDAFLLDPASLFET